MRLTQVASFLRCELYGADMLLTGGCVQAHNSVPDKATCDSLLASVTELYSAPDALAAGLPNLLLDQCYGCLPEHMDPILFTLLHWFDKRQQWQAAIDLFRALSSHHATAAMYLAHAQRQMGQQRAASETLAGAVRAAPHNLQLTLALAADMLAANDAQGAADLARKVIARNDKVRPAWLLLARSLVRLGQHGRALVALNLMPPPPSVPSETQDPLHIILPSHPKLTTKPQHSPYNPALAEAMAVLDEADDYSGTKALAYLPANILISKEPFGESHLPEISPSRITHAVLAAACSILHEVVQAVGWDGFLDVRGSVFVMQVSSSDDSGSLADTQSEVASPKSEVSPPQGLAGAMAGRQLCSRLPAEDDGAAAPGNQGSSQRAQRFEPMLETSFDKHHIANYYAQRAQTDAASVGLANGSVPKDAGSPAAAPAAIDGTANAAPAAAIDGLRPDAPAHSVALPAANSQGGSRVESYCASAASTSPTGSSNGAHSPKLPHARSKLPPPPSAPAVPPSQVYHPLTVADAKQSSSPSVTPQLWSTVFGKGAKQAPAGAVLPAAAAGPVMAGPVNEGSRRKVIKRTPCRRAHTAFWCRQTRASAVPRLTDAPLFGSPLVDLFAPPGAGSAASSSAGEPCGCQAQGHRKGSLSAWHSPATAAISSPGLKGPQQEPLPLNRTQLVTAAGPCAEGRLHRDSNAKGSRKKAVGNNGMWKRFLDKCQSDQLSQVCASLPTSSAEGSRHGPSSSTEGSRHGPSGGLAGRMAECTMADTCSPMVSCEDNVQAAGASHPGAGDCPEADDPRWRELSDGTVDSWQAYMQALTMTRRARSSASSSDGSDCNRAVRAPAGEHTCTLKLVLRALWLLYRLALIMRVLLCVAARLCARRIVSLY